MSVKKYTETILEELSGNTFYMKDEEFERLTESLLSAGHIFTAGAGRSGLAITAFTNRLMHLGFDVSRVGEITSPHSAPGDLLLIGSASGETDSLKILALKAKKNGVKIALLTTDKASSIARIADVCAVIPGASKLGREDSAFSSVQPMGSTFEQLLFLTLDGIVLELMDRLGEDSGSMYARHADLE